MISADSKILFDKFEIIDYLKKDDYSSVYLADHIYLGKKIVLKVLDKRGIKDDSIVERFKREAKLLAGLDHPNIIKVLDFGIYGDFFYISFEYFESNNLRYYLNRSLLNNEQKTDLIKQLFIALHFAHQHKIIHRDIKPENIFVNENLQLKMGDFGLAYMAGDSFVTNKSAVVGTPAYMAPEQILGEAVTEKSDLFSTGVLAYELFTGKNLFFADDINQTINNILNFDYDAAVLILKNVPDEIAGIISKLINVDPENRFSSALEVLEQLNVNPNELAEFSAASKKHVKIRASSRNILVLIISLILIAVPVFYWLNETTDTPNLYPSTDEQILANGKPDTDSPETFTEEKNDFQQNETKTQIGTASVTDNTVRNNENNTPNNEEISHGTLIINCLPWANVYIDSEFFDSTPLENEVNLTEGIHKLTLKNPGYPDYETEIKIQPGKENIISFNLDALFAFLKVKVHPWGKIFVDSNEVGDTPLYSPIVITAGIHNISIVNPELGKFNKRIEFIEGDTVEVSYNFLEGNRTQN